MADSAHAYNSVWQLRGDSWCRLEEAAERLTRPSCTGKLREQYVAVCGDLLAELAPLEPYWAYPGSSQFARVQRLFTAGSYDKFAQMVARINRALTTDSYRTGDVQRAGLDGDDVYPTDPGLLEQQPATKTDQLYFEVLVVESMTEAQERALRREVRSWRRPDDEFVYKLVVVSSGDEAMIAARLNVNLQAVVIRRRFSHRSTRDLSTLAEFVDTKVSDEVADQQSPDERTQILASSLAELSPELDLYLMTEIEVEDVAGRLGLHFRRVFHASEGVLELHLSILQGVAARYRTPFFSALKEYCHRSHHYGMLLAGANVIYLEAYPLTAYTMYGAVPLREMKSKLLALRRAGKLDRVKMISLTNCTFDGIVYDVERVMEECLAIKPDLVFLWDEAWFAFARFHPVYRNRTAMAAARTLRERLQDKAYGERYEAYLAADAKHPPTDDELLNRRLIPDPAKARVRVYATQSTHKTLTSLRQGSMIHVFDQDFDQKVSEPFHEAYMAHTSTSPNYQILASLDLGRRQVALEGVELVQRQIENAMQLRDAIDNNPLLSRYVRCLRTSDLIPEEYRPSQVDQPLRTHRMMAVWDVDEFVLDPSRITLSIGKTGFDGDEFKRAQLMDRYGVQINKTSRNTVLFMTNIGTTRSSVAFLVEVLVKIARELVDHVTDMSPRQRADHEQKVLSLTNPAAPLPNFSGFHPSFRPGAALDTPEGDLRRAFYVAYDDALCEYLTLDEVQERLDAGTEVVSATFITPYPPGFPVLVPGQLFSQEIMAFMRTLDTKEVHGLRPDLGYRVFLDKAMEIAAANGA